jgi:hypothetical protein
MVSRVVQNLALFWLHIYAKQSHRFTKCRWPSLQTLLASSGFANLPSPQISPQNYQENGGKRLTHFNARGEATPHLFFQRPSFGSSRCVTAEELGAILRFMEADRLADRLSASDDEATDT